MKSLLVGRLNNLSPILALIIGGLGALLAMSNFHLSFLRYPLHRLTRKDQPFTSPSGIPLAGSILLWVSAYMLLSGGAPRLGAFALILSVFDTGGVHWFLVALGYRWLRGR